MANDKKQISVCISQIDDKQFRSQLSDKGYFAYIESFGHSLRRLSNGEIDIFYIDISIHNGPGCIKCGESWCKHCRDKVEFCEGNA